MFKFVSSSLLVFCIITAPVQAAPRVSLSDKAALQAAMHKEIDRHSIAGKYLHFNLKTRKVSTLYPAKSHPTILTMGEYFILCSDFRKSDGKSVNVDFYLARNAKSFIVFKAAIDRRGVIQKLMKAGRAHVLR